MARAFLGLGSNLGDRRAFLQLGIDTIPDIVAVSPLFESDPVGGPEQGRFLNLVVELDTDLSPRELLEICRTCERAAERVREQRWGPRTLDVDVLWVDGAVVNEPDLVVPHPRLFDRAFVVEPLRCLAPELVPADWVAPAEQALTNIGEL